MLVRWTTTAADDLSQICDYTQKHFGAAQARRAALMIYECVDSLSMQPQRGRPGRKPNTRELDVRKLPFIVIYRIRGSVLEINRILHDARRWP